MRDVEQGRLSLWVAAVAAMAAAMCLPASARTALESPAGALRAAAPAPGGTAGPAFTERVWAVEDGLPQASIRDIAQTPDGYLWLATYGGLVRFDGLHFRVIGSPTLPSLASNQVQAIAPAPGGGLWVAAVGADVFRTDGRRELEALPAFPNSQRLRRLVVAPDGTLWSVTDSAIHHYSGGRWTSFTPPGSRLTRLRTLTVGRSGTAWAGGDGGLFRIDNGRATAIDAGAIGPGDFVAAIFEDGDERLWAGGSMGLVALPGARGRPRSAGVVAGIGGTVSAVTEAADGTLWVATSAGIVLLPRDGSGRRGQPRSLATSPGSAGVRVTHLRPTPSGGVVAGTPDAGLRVFTPRLHRLLGRDGGLPDVRVHHVAPDGAGGAWLGASCAGLTHVSAPPLRTVTVHAPPALGLTSKCVRGVLRSRAGDLWVGQAGGGLTRIGRDGTWRAWDPASGLPRASLGPLLEDRSGRLWVGTSSGTVCRIDRDDRVTCPAAILDEPPEAIWSLAEDDAGAIWIGQVGRLTRVSGSAVRTFTAGDGIPPAPIRAMRATRGDTVWLATYGAGLARWRAGRTVSITTRQALFDDTISAIVEGEGDEVWLLGNRGVFVTNMAALEAAADGAGGPVDGAVLGPADGFPEGNGGHPAAARLAARSFGFATVNGLAIVDAPLRASGSPPAVAVDEVIGAATDARNPHEVVVPPGGGPIDIRFSAPSIGAAGAVRVRYQLVGRDPGWFEAGADRRAPYSDLAPGTYAFRVASRHAAGPWSSPATAVTIRVQPLWWQTLGFRLLAVSAGAAGLAWLVHRRLAAVEHRNRVLAREIDERRRAQEEAHQHLLALAHVSRLATAGELAASLAHELGQPLTAIVANAEASRLLLGAPQPDRERVAGILTEIGQQGRRASEVITGLRRFLGRGGQDPVAVDLNAVVRDVMTLLDSTLVPAGIRSQIDLAEDTPIVRGHAVPLEQVIINLVVNAVDAMRDQPAGHRCLVVRTRRAAGRARVSVLDSGAGLPLGRAESCFEAFRTTKASGMGMGLPICRSIVETHGGRIRGRNRPGGGAVFSLTLPPCGAGDAAGAG